MLNFYNILLPIPFNEGFTYSSSEALEVGTYVVVSFGKKIFVGLVISEAKVERGDADLLGDTNTDIKPIESVLPTHPAGLKYIEFVKFLSNYNMAPLGSCLALGLSNRLILDAYKKKKWTGVKNLNPEALPEFDIQFSKAQVTAVENLQEHVGDKFSCTLLEGITGSGKTEVYLKAVYDALIRGEQVAIILPEIALTDQVIKRIEDRLNFEAVKWHSSVTIARKRDAWISINNGDAKLIIGARSALFLPYKNLKLIIIDEEHDTSLIQDEGVIYNARNMAVAYANMSNIPIILSTATPSAETMLNVRQGKYSHIQLLERYGGAELPEIHTINLKEDRPKQGSWISEQLREELIRNFEQGEQSMLYLNRRGFAPLMICKECGERMECGSCDAYLTAHMSEGAAKCHYCGANSSISNSCGSCGAVDSFIYTGPGVERIRDEVKSFMPNARVAILSSDITSTAKQISEVLNRVKNGEIDIIIGTQIVTKGHHFPNLTMVASIDSDVAYADEDVRAVERTLQSLIQVTGRAGREQKRGVAYIQTYNPNTNYIKALIDNDYSDFLDKELAIRKRAHAAPYLRQSIIKLICEDEDLVINYARYIMSAIPKSDEIKVLGPASAPMYKVRNKYNYLYMLKSARGVNVQNFITQWLESCPAPRGLDIRVQIDG